MLMYSMLTRIALTKHNDLLNITVPLNEWKCDKGRNQNKEVESGFDLYMWKGYDDGDVQEQTWFRVATDGGCKTAFCNQQAAFPNVDIKTCHLTGRDAYQGGSDELCIERT